MRRWLFAAVVVQTTMIVGCPGRETSAGSNTDGEIETDTGQAESGTSATTGSGASTTDETVTTSDTTTTSTTTGPSTSTSSSTTMEPETTSGCPVGTEGCPCDGFECEIFLTCDQGICTSDVPCDEPEGEPNDTEADAVELGDAVCNEDPLVVMGVFDGDDLDWFSYQGQPSALACIDGGSPSVDVTAQEAVWACIFVACTTGDPGSVTSCPTGLVADTSPDGLPGCCGGETASLSSQAHGCVDGDPIYLVSAYGAERLDCLPYDMTYEYSEP